MARPNIQRAIKPLTTDEPHLPGTVLRTDNPLVGVLVEQTERRLVTTLAIPEGTVLFRIEGHETRTPTKYSLQVGRDLHLDQRGARDASDRVRRFYWRYMNHSCAPSTRILDREVIAVRDIAALEGVTFDYNTTESDLAEPFACHCGSTHCVGTVRGAKHLTPAQRARVAALLPDYLR
jgi:SET domain